MSEVLAALEHVVVDRPLERGGAVRALDGVSMRVHEGELVVVTGAGGAGKSTLASALAGLVRPAAGRVLHAAGAQGRPPVALLLQRAERALFCPTVGEDVGAAPTSAGYDPPGVVRLVDDALTAVGLDPALREVSPFALSGGEQRRVALAGVLAASPRVLVLDEPGAGLDEAARAGVRRAVDGALRGGAGVVWITHDPEEAARADRLVVLAGGRIVHDGPPAPVLAVPSVAARLGVECPPLVHAAAGVAQATGLTAPQSLDPDDLHAFIHAARAARGAGSDPGTKLPPAASYATPPSPPPAGWLVPALRAAGRALDARARIVTFALFLAAVFLATSLVASGVVLGVAAVAALLLGPPLPALARALAPLVLAVGVLVALQLLVGSDPAVVLVGERTIDSDLAYAGRRAAQLLAVVLASLTATHGVDAVELADGTAWLLAPLRALRLPVTQVALVLSMALAFVPSMARDLRDVQAAQAARGLRQRRGLTGAVRRRSAVLVPMLVHALRRARHLGDALTVRGFRPGARRRPWRPLRPGAADAAPVLGAAALLVGVVVL